MTLNSLWETEKQVPDITDLSEDRRDDCGQTGRFTDLILGLEPRAQELQIRNHFIVSSPHSNKVSDNTKHWLLKCDKDKPYGPSHWALSFPRVSSYGPSWRTTRATGCSLCYSTHWRQHKHILYTFKLLRLRCWQCICVQYCLKAHRWLPVYLCLCTIVKIQRRYKPVGVVGAVAAVALLLPPPIAVDEFAQIRRLLAVFEDELVLQELFGRGTLQRARTQVHIQFE